MAHVVKYVDIHTDKIPDAAKRKEWLDRHGYKFNKIENHGSYFRYIQTRSATLTGKTDEAVTEPGVDLVVVERKPAPRKPRVAKPKAAPPKAKAPPKIKLREKPKTLQGQVKSYANKVAKSKAVTKKAVESKLTKRLEAVEAKLAVREVPKTVVTPPVYDPAAMEKDRIIREAVERQYQELLAKVGPNYDPDNDPDDSDDILDSDELDVERLVGLKPPKAKKEAKPKAAAKAKKEAKPKAAAKPKKVEALGIKYVKEIPGDYEQNLNARYDNDNAIIRVIADKDYLKPAVYRQILSELVEHARKNKLPFKQKGRNGYDESDLERVTESYLNEVNYRRNETAAALRKLKGQKY